MSDNPPTPPLAQDDGIPTIHINLSSCYLIPAGAVEPQLPDGTLSYDAQENYWKPLPNDPKRQEFRIQGKNEFVFIAGAQYTYKPNTSLHIKCKKATFMPHPTDPNQKTVIVRLPGADAEQNVLPKPGHGKRGTTASFQSEIVGGPYPTRMVTRAATEGGEGADGAIGSQGGDAGSLTIDADSYDTSALADNHVFFILECTGGNGQQGGHGGDGGGGGNGVDAAGESENALCDEIDRRFAFRMPQRFISLRAGVLLGFASDLFIKHSDNEHEELIVKGFLGAKGGTAGQQGVGGYGGSGGQFTINLPEESAGNDRLISRFGVQSRVGITGTAGEVGKPGLGGRCGSSELFKLPRLNCAKDKLHGELRSKLQFDWSSEVVNKWAAYLANGTEPPLVNGDIPKALDEQEIQHRRAHAGQHEPTTSPNVVFEGADKT